MYRLRFIIAFFLMALRFNAVAQQAHVPGAFIGEWTGKDSGYSISADTITLISNTWDGNWRESFSRMDAFTLIDKPITNAGKVFECWAVKLETIVADLEKGPIEVYRTATYCVFRMELVGGHNIKLDISTPVIVSSTNKEVDLKVTPAMRIAFLKHKSWSKHLLLHYLTYR